MKSVQPYWVVLIVTGAPNLARRIKRMAGATIIKDGVFCLPFPDLKSAERYVTEMRVDVKGGVRALFISDEDFARGGLIVGPRKRG